MISQLWTKLMQAAQRPPAAFSLTADARHVLMLAQARGYRITETARQGSPVILIEKEGTGSAHLWSSANIVAYTQNNGWI